LLSEPEQPKIEPKPEPKKNYNTDTRLLTDTYDSVLSDDFNFLIFWGPARYSKTTLSGWVLHNLYNNDWNKVLQAITFNLDQTIDKIENGLPERVWTTNKYHSRVPGIVWDDFSATGGNKALSQYDTAFDELKSSFDVMGTSIANLMLTMLDPSSITNQLMWKYTSEVQLLNKGVYKYDKVFFQQDFRGWRTRIKKIPIEHNTFDKWPNWVYEEYDQIRMSLVPQAFQRIRDAQKLSKLDELLQTVNWEDLTALRRIQTLGPVRNLDLAKYVSDLGGDGKNCTNRCKSRNLLSPVRCGDNYWKLDFGYLGREVLKAIEKDKKLETDINNRKPQQ